MEDNSDQALNVRKKDEISNTSNNKHKINTEQLSYKDFRDIGVFPLKCLESSSTYVISSKAAKRFCPLLRKNSESSQTLWPNKVPFGPVIRGLRDNFALFRQCPQSSVGSDQFCKLSDEIILQVFKWLPKSSLAACAQVNKRWKALSYDESLWKRINLGRRRVPPGVVGIVINRGAVVLRLNTSEIQSPAFFSSNITTSSKLQFLDLSLAVVSENDLAQILSCCSRLKKVSLEKCALNDTVCSLLAANSMLEELNMSMCTGVTPSGIAVISMCNMRLQAWNLSWLKLTEDAISVLSQHIPSSIKYLNISGCSLLQDDAFSMIISRCPNLIELDISDDENLTCNSIPVIINKLPLLKHLCCNRCYKIKPISYLLLNEMENLKGLDIFSGLSSHNLECIKRNLPNIKINSQKISTIARPAMGIKETVIWGIGIRNCA